MRKILLIIIILPSLIFAQRNETIIKNYIIKNKFRDYIKSDLIDFKIDNVDVSKSLGADVVKIQQIYQGIPVHLAAGTVLIKDNTVVYYSDNFIKDYNVSESTIKIDKKNAIQNIAEQLKITEIMKYPTIGFYDPNPETLHVVKNRLVYVKTPNNNLQLAYEFLIREPQSPNYWNILVSTENGEIVSKVNLTSYCNFHSNTSSQDFILNKEPRRPFTKLFHKENHKFSVMSPDNASYQVFKLPVEAPTFGLQTIVSNPWILSASPEGWHSDGTNHYTITRGNNIYSYIEKEDGDVVYSPDGGAGRDFNNLFNITGDYTANEDAVVTNLFYTSNKAHDIFYQFGFTESARNFQQNNFGNGGLGNDFVLTEAQNMEERNNSYFSSTPEGTPGAMTLFLWSDAHKVFYNAPNSAISRYALSRHAEFGPALDNSGITGDIKLSSELTGCTSLAVGSLTGKIGLVKGISPTDQNCSFTDKVKNAQNAGAIAVVLYNDKAYSIPELFGSDPSILIPSVLIDNSEGEYIKSQLDANVTVNVTLKKDPATMITPDSSVDNGVIIHEYGHGVTNRLTGTGYGCLNATGIQGEGYSREQMGEGWSDFFALMLTNTAGNNSSVARGIGTYIMAESPDGVGLRPARYSPDFSINDFTYGMTNGMELNNEPDVHSIGFVWATMLWDLHWKYAEKYGYAPDVLVNMTNGSSRILQLVMDALKLQPCNPTFTEGRNAILAADQATTGGEDKCMIWNVFAKRGLGVHALAGDRTNINDQIEDFTVPLECNTLGTVDTTVSKNTISFYPNPAKNEFHIVFPDHIMGKISIQIYDMSGKLVFSDQVIALDGKGLISTDQLINGTYLVKAKGLAFEAVSKIIIEK
ncbi:T9SS-dependent M36 family metallopeptidase [Chryseobacterium potabilaquae]|uniref:Por secretion system C-terminal sorting domain-containing protein n=1 Tax=Chryseobacterium potabilaquae TaxID=2675057 RepID=A0A6N4X9T2_9FLAO|nr:T9SS-dependent M36 family metallopeptidase [Chryseobacterium potabilaquae]CAA7197056.1 hypothetical protein CHRY9293_03113 [Chryseobacterium potabilaquae]